MVDGGVGDNAPSRGEPVTARIEVPPGYLASVFNRYQTGQGEPPAIQCYLVAGYGSATEGPPFVLRGIQPAWLGPRPIALAFTVTIQPEPPP